MDGTIQNYTLDMAADTKKEPLRVKQYDTNSRLARITLKMGGEPWTIPFGAQIYINVRKTDGTLADATCTREDEHTVLAPITEQMTAVTGTQLGELYFLGSDGDIKSQSFPVVVYEAVMDQARIESSDDFQSLQGALRQVQISTDAADIAAQYATEQGNQARDGAQRANDAADSIQVAVDAAANAKACESNAKNSELAAAQTQQEVTDYVEAQKAAFAGYSKRETDSKYANALTETATGEGGVTVDDAWTAPVLGLDVVGKSEQVVTTGANLFDIVHADNIKGVASGDELYYVRVGQNSAWVESTKIPFAGESNVIYTLSAKVKCGTATNLGIAFCYSDGTFEMSNRVNDTTYGEVKVTSKADKTVNGFGFIYVSADTSGYIKDIQLQKGSTATTYEPYTGGAPSPSPDYPQDIISVGTVSTGKQMLNADTIVQGGINADTGATNNASNFVRSDYIPVKPGDYVLSGDELKSYLNYVMYFNQEKVIQSSLSIKPTNGKFTVTEGIAYIRIRFIAKDGAEGTVIPSEVVALKPMLNTGDTALPWEPYTGGKPSPSVEYPQTLELVVTGAQMFYKSLVTLQGTGAEADITDKRAIKITYTRANGGKYAGFIVDDKSNIVGKTLTISYGSIIPSKSGLTPGIRLYWIDINGSVLSYVVYVNKSPTTITIEDPQNDMATKLALLLYADIGDAAVVNDYVIYKDIMINAGDTPLPWEPYKDRQTAPVTLTEPLHGTGECRDRIACKDGEWGIERYIGVVDNGQWRKLNVASGSAGHRFVYDATDMIEKLNCMVICSKYTRRPKGASFNAIGDYVATDEVGKIFIRTLNPDFETIEAFREFIADAITLYPLAVPTWTPLPSATQQALNELTTYAGTTHLTITAGGTTPTVTLDYVQDTHKALEQCQEEAKEYTDNQIAAIVAALPTATQAAIVDNQTTKLLQEV
nr:MAG TPA: BppU domain protein [Caudoviricetes sp.]